MRHKLPYLRAARRDVRREQTPEPPPDWSDPGWEALASDPTPSHAAALTETVDLILAALEEYQREIFRLRLDAYSPAEIAPRGGVTERTVQRILKRIREQLEAMADGPMSAE